MQVDKGMQRDKGMQGCCRVQGDKGVLGCSAQDAVGCRVPPLWGLAPKLSEGPCCLRRPYNSIRVRRKARGVFFS